MDGEPGENPTLFPEKVGEKLRDARQAQGLELSDIAARTRIPLRHLQAIETSDYSGLPSPTYAVGFVKAYARAIGADEVALAKELRAETSSMFAAREAYESYDPEDPVREPSSGLVWAGSVIAVLLRNRSVPYHSASAASSSTAITAPAQTSPLDGSRTGSSGS